MAMNTIIAAGIKLQGHSLAGEESVVCVPELDVVFDIGKCPREALTPDVCALSHGHMDHAAGIAYYLSQRNFIGNAPGTVVCHPSLIKPIGRLLDAWRDVEGHRSPGELVGVEPGDEYEICRGRYLQAFAVRHSAGGLGFAIVERRSKLKPEFLDEHGEPKLSGRELAELKKHGETLTYDVDIPLVAYTGDTAPGDWSRHPMVTRAKVLVMECTFFEQDHVRRARHGQHTHVRDLPEIFKNLENEQVIISHVTRRTPLSVARRMVRSQCRGMQILDRVAFLMDRRYWRERLAELDEANGNGDAAISTAGAAEASEG